ncbi:DUF4190 domain-containing protein [Sphaerimonospora cavernae]|uniref:DUF4190 domain-containing protein n=1 Tax=Sphaerimonospora cavernae TaxID=1740611 RepID=A0ABV6UDL7_9ACTN
MNGQHPDAQKQPPYGPYGSPSGYGYPAYTPPGRTTGFAIASLILGLTWICWLGSILAVIFGHVALSQNRNRGAGGKGLAITGLVLGYIGTVTLVISIAVAIAAPQSAPFGNTGTIEATSKSYSNKEEIAAILKDHGIACNDSWSANFLTATGEKLTALECAVTGVENGGTWIQTFATKSENEAFVKYVFSPEAKFVSPDFDFKVVVGENFVVHASYFDNPEEVANLLGGTVIDADSLFSSFSAG